ncbi:MAG: hypothetical protein K2J80_03840 [Oscillospiraceae bacterium]|nr:hypothetical protein [Oscillospiraceae bacterium]
MTIQIVIGSREFSAVLYDNAAAALKDLLPMTLDMSEFNGNEKYNYLSDKLPTDQSSPKKICAGDIMLYGDNCLVLFYEDLSTSFSYTPIGRLNDPEGLAKAVGRGSVTVTWH